MMAIVSTLFHAYFRSIQVMILYWLNHDLYASPSYLTQVMLDVLPGKRWKMDNILWYDAILSFWKYVEVFSPYN